jgi:hypothetical protein
MDNGLRPLSEKEVKNRRPRAIATALVLGLFAAAVYVISIFEWMPRGAM